MKEKKEFVFDVRVADRYVREGVVKKADYEEYLKTLPDVSDKSCPLMLDEGVKEELETKLENKDGEPG
jgi:hypothetical protein